MAAGGLVALQSRLNGGLRLALDDVLLTAVLSFGSGLLVVAAVVACRPESREALATVRAAPWWSRAGGLGGALLVVVAATVAPVLGVALLTVGLVAGQTSGALLVDGTGLGPGGRRALTSARLAGALLCLGAAALPVLGGTGHASLLLLALALLAGFVTSLQQAVNGRLRESTGDVAVATFVNFLVGTAALVAGLLVHVALEGFPAADWPGVSEGALYAGGLLGAIFVGVAAAVVRVLGVLRLGLALISGQLIGAVLLDLLAPLPGASVSAVTAAAAALTLVAVGITGLGTR